MKRIPILTFTAFLLLALSSCKNKSGLFIPADAVAVFHVAPSSLSSKISWDEIKNSTWFKQMHQHSDDTLVQQIMNNPEASGVDTKNDFFFFMAKRGSGGYNVFEGTIKNAAAFEAVNKKAGRKNTVEKDGDWSMITMDNNSMVAWNNKKFAYINNMPGMSVQSPVNYGGQRNNRSNFGADSLRVIVINVLTNDGKSLTDDDRFKSLLKENGDMHFWLNSSAMYSSSMSGMMSMMKIGTLLEGNATAATMNFEDGKMTVKTKSYFGKEMQKLMEKYDSKNISADLLNRIPSQNVLGVIATNINPQTAKEFFKAAGLDGLVNMAFSGQNFTIDDVFAATGGQFLFSVSDVSMKDTTVSFGEMEEGKPTQSIKIRKPDFTFLFATSVAQKPAFEKLLNLATEKMGAAPFAYKLTGNWFAAGNKQTSVDGFLSGAGVKQVWADKITGHPFGMYVDLQKIFRSNLSEDSTVNAFMLESAGVWQDVIATGGEYKNGTSTAEFVVNMVDKKTNSLKQLNAFIDKVNTLNNTRMKRMMEEERNDDRSTDTMASPTLKAPPAVDTAN